MERALIVSSSDKGAAFISEMLDAVSVREVTTLKSCGEARLLLSEEDFDLVAVNAPLRDESGERFSRHIAAQSAALVILIVDSEFFDAVSAACEEDGVLTVSKPVNRTVFRSLLRLARSTQSRVKKIREENGRLKQKIEDIRVIDRAKCLLISYLNMSEQEAHRYIEKQAMDLRQPRRAVAEGILKTYEN
ncbi:MAG: ANTAR domain-containing protein [Oscillospiraceae bacterium]|jgi:response regulator NasT|nr:ANTAR domain-containing protein [Oscillospiraceae bacterium]